jgi:hypothetical protein
MGNQGVRESGLPNPLLRYPLISRWSAGCTGSGVLISGGNHAMATPLTPWPPAALYPAALLPSSLMKDNSGHTGSGL